MQADSKWRGMAMLRGWGAVALGYTLAGVVTTLLGTNLHIMRESWLDRMVPFDPRAIWIYLSFFVIIALAFFTAPKDRIERLVRAMQICGGVACSIFVIFPTSLEYPAVTGAGASVGLLQVLKWLDVSSNCLPSLHSALTTASLLTLWSARQWFHTMLVTLWALAICVSIVQLRRHVAIDVMAGAILGASSFAVAWFIRPRTDPTLRGRQTR